MEFKTSEFGKRLRELRHEKGITGVVLARKIGVRDSTISMWETGKRTPDLFHFFDLVVFFQTSAMYLLGLED